MSLVARVANQTANGNAGVRQPLHYSLFHRYSEYIETREWDIAETLSRLSSFRTSTADQQNGPYVHDCHLGAAALKIAEREGIHEGIRRKRDIGSRARAR